MDAILGALGRASLQGAIVIAAVWLVCRLIPRLPASVRCGLWWLACARLVLGLVWAEPVRLAVLPAAEPVVSVRHPEARDELKDLGGRTSPPPRSFRLVPRPQDDVPGLNLMSWQTALLALWSTGVLALLGLTLWQHRRARQVVRRSAPVEEAWLSGLFGDLREQLGVPRSTAVRLSSEVETPQVLGLVRPVVLLPAAAPARLSRPEIAMTLCHELVHVRRGDLWLGWVPALAQRLFFFHPLALLAVREYALAREAACDAEVLRVLDPAPETYGRLLLRLGVSPQTPKLAAAGAAPSFQILKRRLQMLQNSSDKKRLHPAWWALVACAALAGLIPFTITAQEAPPAPEAPPAVEALPAPPAPVSQAELPPPAPARAPLPVARVAQHHAPPPAPPAPPAPPTPPTPPTPPHPVRLGMHGDGDSYVLLLSGKSTIMSGSTWDIAKARKLRKSDDEQLFWFEHGGKEYVVHDAATVARVKALFEPQQKLGEQQGELGAKQGELGARQGALGAQQAQQGVKQAELGARMARLAAEQARLAQEDKSTESLEAQMEQLEKEQDQLAKPQEDLGRQQEALGRQQEELGRQQEALGRQQEALAKEAEKQLKALTDSAIANGTAQEVK
jgi:beta-lactamase regulating signal transducer with metallopeptidase domain